eukprot:137971-Pyramimonas_sp.AAC.1
MDMSTDQVIEASGTVVGDFTLASAAREWRRMHAQIMTPHLQKIGAVPINRPDCFEAGRCVCQGDLGMCIRLFVAR